MRSMKPPCPGSSWLASLTPKARLSADSARSPACATSAIRRPASATGSGALPSRAAKIAAASPAASTPPRSPLHVLLGEMRGASRGPPISRPARNAAVSVTATMTTRNRIAVNPHGSLLRSQSSATAGSPAYITPVADSIVCAPNSSASTMMVPIRRTATPSATNPRAASTTAARTQSPCTMSVRSTPSPRTTRDHSHDMASATTSTSAANGRGPAQQSPNATPASTSPDRMRVQRPSNREVAGAEGGSSAAGSAGMTAVLMRSSGAAVRRNGARARDIGRWRRAEARARSPASRRRGRRTPYRRTARAGSSTGGTRRWCG